MRMHAARPHRHVAATLAVACAKPGGRAALARHLTIGTASPGGTYYVYGRGLARILTRDLDLPVVMRPTEGPAENIALLEAGEAKLGFVTVGVALQAWNATGVWAGKAPARALRAIFPMYDTPFQLLALQDTNIRSVADMAGKRIGVGPRGGTSATYFPDIFNALKVSATFVHGDWADLAVPDARAVDRRPGGRRRRAVSLLHRARVQGQGPLHPARRGADRGAAAGHAGAHALARAGRHVPVAAAPLPDGRASTISPSRTPTCRTISSTTSCASCSRGTKR